MNRTDHAGASVAVDSGEIGKSNHPEGGLLTVVNINTSRNKSAALNEEAAVLSREQAVSAREFAAQLREDAADSRERDIQAAEDLQNVYVDNAKLLQQANTRQFMLAIEAQHMTKRLDAVQLQLESAQCLAEEANLAKSDFLLRMSQEFRAPLNTILAFAQLMESSWPPLTSTQEENLDQILQAGWHLLRLTNQIPNLAAIESRKLPLSQERVLLINVMCECKAMVESTATRRNIHVSFRPFDPAWFVMVDPIGVKQVLSNLLTNAIKYNCEDGAVEVSCTATSPERMRISVKDTGLGLPAEKLMHLFEPTSRIGQAALTAEGPGIGLIVSRQLVELMGGAIGVQSTVGVGSEFWIELIREPCHEQS